MKAFADDTTQCSACLSGAKCCESDENVCSGFGLYEKGNNVCLMESARGRALVPKFVQSWSEQLLDTMRSE